jgi:hypothetical protein
MFKGALMSARPPTSRREAFPFDLKPSESCEENGSVRRVMRLNE